MFEIYFLQLSLEEPKIRLRQTVILIGITETRSKLSLCLVAPVK